MEKSCKYLIILFLEVCLGPDCSYIGVRTGLKST